MSLDLSNFGGLVSNLGSLLPSQESIIQNVALGAATSVVIAGLKSDSGKNALDPLGLFHGREANNPSSVVGPTVTASAFASLPPATQAQLAASGVHIVAG